MAKVNANGDVFPVGEYGTCVAQEWTHHKNGDYGSSKICHAPGVYIEEIYEMSQPGYQNIRIRCICADHGSETTYCCIKCRKLMYDWSPTHTKNECNINIVRNVMDI